MSARILVVDDILPNVKLLEAKLMSEYYEVITATSGEEALQKLETDNPDIILLDVMMPGMDGFEVCKRIKENTATAHIPVVMVTALTDTEDKVRGLEAGADDFLSKPINDIALMARVRSLVRLKMALDEWRNRENTASELGVVDESAKEMEESAENAHVLIIEDRDFELQRIQDVLEQDHNSIMAVDNGIKAMELTAENDFDIIIVSLNLTNEDGLRLVSHLKSAEKTRSIPIVMVGEEADMERIAHGLEIGAHDYILRPADKNELLARVRTQVRRKRFQERLRSTYEVSLSMALTDTLTGLYNRRYLEVHLEKLLEKNKESKKKLAVVMVDIDHFKAVNDTHGHGVGDEILKSFANRLKGRLRSFDLVARMGGEEFIVILPDVSSELAYQVTERLRARIADKPFACAAKGGQLDISASFGGTIVNWDDTRSMSDILETADKGLYEAKEGGRNCAYFDTAGKIDPAKFSVPPRKIAQ